MLINRLHTACKAQYEADVELHLEKNSTIFPLWVFNTFFSWGYILFRRRIVEYLANLQTFGLILKPSVLLFKFDSFHNAINIFIFTRHLSRIAGFSSTICIVHKGFRGFSALSRALNGR